MNEVFKDEFVDKKGKKKYTLYDFVRFKKDTPSRPSFSKLGLMSGFQWKK